MYTEIQNIYRYNHILHLKFNYYHVYVGKNL